MICVYLGLGTNLGHREAHLQHAAALVGERIGRVVCASDVYYSKPWGFKSDHDFANMVLCVETRLMPTDLLHVTQAIERDMGRTHKSVGGVYHDRIIDIDVLLYGRVTIWSEHLVVPHPLMHERDFVLVPLRDVMNKMHESSSRSD